MRTLATHGRRWGWATLTVGLAVPHLTGCGAYVLHGRVVQGQWSTAAIVASDDPRLAEKGVGGTTVVLRRDPQNMNARDVAQAVSDANGAFELRIDEFGAGWMEEQWLVRGRRPAMALAEAMITLPANPRGRLLLIELGPGDSGSHGASGASGTTPWHEDYKEQLERFR